MGTKKRSDRSTAWGVALALFGLTMLFWNGTFHSSDGLSTYAVSDSLARYGRWDTEQVRWLAFQQGVYGPDGILYSKKGLGTSLMALPLTVAGMFLPGLGPVHTSLLLMPLLTAAAGALVYLVGRRAFPSLPRRAAILAALAWGLGSPAWVYGKTFFDGPLVALATIGAMERLLAFGDARTASRSETAASLGLGCWLCLGLLARPAHAIVVPIFLLALVVITCRRHRTDVAHSYSKPLLAVALPLALAGFVSLGYNWVRFGHPLVTGYLPQETLSANWWQGLIGLSVSPGRGLLWYAPWVVIVLAGLPLVWGRSRLIVAASMACCLAYFLLYAKWYLWHGGYCWGPRFLVPILPLLGFLAVPAAARWSRIFGLLVALGVGVNLIGVAWAVDQHQALSEARLPIFDPRTFFDPHYAQIPGVLRLGRWETLDVAWMIEGRIHPALATSALALAAVGVVGGLLLVSGRRVNLPRAPWTRGRVSLWWMALVLAAMTYAFLWQAGRLQAAGYRRVAAAIAAYSPPGTMIWNDDHSNISTFLNLYKGRAAILGLFEPDDTLSAHTEQQLFSLRDLPQPVWVIDRGPVGTSSVLERTASEHGGVVQEFSVATSTRSQPALAEESEPLKATLYFDTPDWGYQSVDVALGTNAQPLISLEEAALSGDSKPGGVLAVRLVWQELVAATEPLQVRVQLLDPDGKQVGLDVGLLGEANAEPTLEGPDRSVTRVHAFGISEDATVGEYRFVVSVRDLASALPLETTDGRHELVLEAASVVP